MIHIGVIGAGYVGLVTGVSLARAGFRISMVEKDPERLRDLRAGKMPFEEPGLGAAFAEVGNRITVTDALPDEAPDFIFVAVGTPIFEDGDADLTQLHSAVADLARWPSADVSIRSTLPLGMSARLPSLLGRDSGERLSTTPEFLRQGSALYDYENPTRIIIGRYPETSPHHMSTLYRILEPFEAPRLEVSAAAAELIKNAANGYLALKLSYVNEVAILAEELGVDVDDVLSGMALDPRIGSNYMRPGLGFGGSCLPKELRVLASAGRRLGIPMHIARAVSQVNSEQQDRFVRRILQELPARGARVGLLGLSFKADTDDLRGSPALHVARRLLESDHRVTAYDPAVRRERAELAAPGIQVVSTPEEVFDGSEAVVIGTEWPQFAQIDLAAVLQRTARPLLFDGRNLIDPAVAVGAGFEYRGIGRRSRGRSPSASPVA
jgi:UDPglucose 6-dehydrogenase